MISNLAIMALSLTLQAPAPAAPAAPAAAPNAAAPNAAAPAAAPGDKPADKAASDKAAAPKLDVLKTSDPLAYTYNPFGKRDPFRPYLLDKSSDADKNGDPLLNYDLSKFTLTGIIWGISNPRAIVKDGDNKGHIITRGTKIGRNKGSVIRILKNELVIAEEFRDPLGKLIVSEFTMKLVKEGSKK